MARYRRRRNHTEKIKTGRVRVDLGRGKEAFEMNDRYSEYFLDLETGEVTCVNDMMMTGPEKEEINFP